MCPTQPPLPSWATFSGPRSCLGCAAASPAPHTSTSPPDSLPMLGRPCAPPQGHGLAVSGSYAYVTGYTLHGSLAVIDVSDPTAPSIVGSVSSSSVMSWVRCGFAQKHTPSSPLPSKGRPLFARAARKGRGVRLVRVCSRSFEFCGDRCVRPNRPFHCGQLVTLGLELCALRPRLTPRHPLYTGLSAVARPPLRARAGR